jgi:hypothetical protein
LVKIRGFKAGEKEEDLQFIIKPLEVFGLSVLVLFAILQSQVLA